MHWLCTPGEMRCEIHYGVESAHNITERLAGFAHSLPTFPGTEKELKPHILCLYPNNQEPKIPKGISET